MKHIRNPSSFIAPKGAADPDRLQQVVSAETSQIVPAEKSIELTPSQRIRVLVTTKSGTPILRIARERRKGDDWIQIHSFEIARYRAAQVENAIAEVRKMTGEA